jgi:YHS domain-containing protein
MFYVALLSLGMLGTSLAGQPLLPLISTTVVHRTDVVEASRGKPTLGSLEFALRQGDVVHYFVSAANCGSYVAEPGKYPDPGPGWRLALMGADPVARFPKGVHDRALGSLVAGSLDYLTTYHGATFTFASLKNFVQFEMDPDAYVPDVGGYCLGAMSQRHITPGDPRNVFFVPEETKGGMWAVYGSPHGPIAWAAMSPQERREHLAQAHAYYNMRTGLAPPPNNKTAER